MGLLKVSAVPIVGEEEGPERGIEAGSPHVAGPGLCRQKLWD